MDLVDLVPSLKRAVAPPGEFATYFPEANDDVELAALLLDAAAEAQLDGFLKDSTLETSGNTIEPTLLASEAALIVLYGMARVLSSRLSNLKNHTRYKAGSVEAETEQSASIIVELLRQTNARKKQLLEDVKYGNVVGGFAMVDMYIAKSIDQEIWF